MAETVKIGEVVVPVDEIVEVDAKNIKLSIGGNTKLIAKSQLELEVLNLYLNNSTHAANVSADLWKKILNDRIKNKDAQGASLAILLLVNKAKISDSDFSAILQDLFGDEPFSSNIAKLLLTTPQYQKFPVKNQVIIALLAVLGDEAWYRTHFTSDLISIAESLREYAEQRLKTSLQNRDYSQSDKLVNFLIFAYPSFNERYRKYRLATSSMQDLSSKGDDFSLADLLPLISLKNSDKEIREVQGQYIVDALHRLAEKSLAAGNAEETISIISYIALDERTPTTHNIVVRALHALNPMSKVLGNKLVSEMLNTLAVNDPSIKNELVAFLVGKINALLSQYRALEAAEVFNQLTKIIPDPSDGNDRIRIQLALGALVYEDRSSARKFIHEMSSSPSFSEYIDLWVAGLYGNVLFYVIALVIPVVIRYGYEILFASNRRKRIVSAAENQNLSHGRRILAKENVGEEDRPRAFVTAQGTQLNPQYEEYLECLKIFGLQVGSDLKDIKMAYRNAVKEIHPDLHVKNQSPEANTRFVELTQTYDRLRELQRILGLS